MPLKRARAAAASARPTPASSSAASAAPAFARLWAPGSGSGPSKGGASLTACAADPAVTGKLVVDALSDRGRLAAWIPTVDGAARYLASKARPGDVLLVLGAGDVDAAPALLRELLG